MADYTEGVASQLTSSDKTGFFEFDDDGFNRNIRLLVQNNGIVVACFVGLDGVSVKILMDLTGLDKVCYNARICSHEGDSAHK